MGRPTKGDPSRNELIRVGASVVALSQIFDRDVNAVKRVIAKHKIPCQYNEAGTELYPIREVAPYLIDISAIVDVEELLKNTSLKKLPPELTKNYWEAQQAKQKYLENTKQLWRTEAVMEVLLDVFKTLAQAVNLFVDTIGDKTELTPKQRQLIIEMCDGLRAIMREKVIEKFELYDTLEPQREQDYEDHVADD